jgi:hypothetical protein
MPVDRDGIAKERSMTTAPSPSGSNGRGAGGRFGKGNPGGPGNPYAARVGRWRATLAETVTDADMQAVAKTLVKAAKAGEAWAVRELLDRTLGKAVEADLIERLEILETAFRERDSQCR